MALRVGYIGLGNIGLPMAERLLRPELNLTVFDMAEAAAANFQGKARIAENAADVGASADLIGICVRDDADVEQVVTALLTRMRSGLIAIHSTVRPATVLELAARAKVHGVTVIDAAVTGGADGARNGRLTCMVGGDPAALDQARPLLSAYCSNIVHAGATGQGMTLKIVNNLVTYVELLGAVEAYRLAAAAGLDPARLSEVMTDNGNLTPSMRAYVGFRANGPAQIGTDLFVATQTALATLAEKDLALAIDLAADCGLAVPLGDATARLFRDAVTRI
ncbi:NAD(P)-dependent oxidoreductase [Sphingomonas sp. KC8]|uniref:NAD(P)-dependent oxidoreductase n=1 Tax=Sphingomonas sp. KC8 TaxID=1030157 RepID=UPI0002488E86|nr:NAD(P)-dependent oxidoreductase [Sphingomonas sp. KC8]ARS26237.1 putative oxidoreductase [Sphingomonas sp. KC8]